MKLLTKAEDFLLSAHSCIFCRRECDTDSPYRICSRCLKRVDFIGDKFCLKCGVKIGEGYDFCVNCQETSFDFDYSRSVFTYDDLTRPMIMNFKYNGQRTLKAPLGKLLADYYDQSDIVADIVTYVPMPKKRQKARGYNQAKELADEFCTLTGMPLVDVLARTKESERQASLNAKQRAENIKGSFEAINKAKIKKRNILIIDDVSTTGATTSECARVLKKAGASSVAVLTLAKTNRTAINFEVS